MPTRFRTFAIALAALPFVAGTAAASTIDFSTLTGGNADKFSSYTESGFTVTAVTTQWHVAKDFGNPLPDIFAIVASTQPQTIAVTDGSLFTFSSVDLADASGPGSSVGYSITGLLNGTIEFTTPPSSVAATQTPSFKTIDGGSPNTAINELDISLSIQRGAVFGNVDNIVVQPINVPEPISAALFGSGLLAFAAVRRRARPGSGPSESGRSV